VCLFNLIKFTPLPSTVVKKTRRIFEDSTLIQRYSLRVSSSFHSGFRSKTEEAEGKQRNYFYQFVSDVEYILFVLWERASRGRSDGFAREF
jgi:hypothetical protein